MPRPPGSLTNRPDGAQEMAVLIEKWNKPFRTLPSGLSDVD
jgi:hypothetical protein